MNTSEQLRERALGFAASGSRMLLGGRIVDARSGRRYEVINPATGDVVGTAPDASAADVDVAVDAAESAHIVWSRTEAHRRAAIVRQMANVAEKHTDELAALDSIDTGVPLWMMRKDLATGIRRMRMFADWALRLTGETIPATATHLLYTERTPFGLVARIVAYNHPAMFAISKIAAPLVAGNAVVLKPSEQTPLSALRLGELWADVVPAGVLGIVTGSSPEPGVHLVADARVRRIAFTGSARTGRSIQQGAANVAVKQVSLELGGKNALVILDDADLDDAAAGAVKGMNFAFGGQSCGSTSRLLVPSRLRDDVADRVSALFGALRAGDPFDEDVQVGPMISSAHRQYVGRCVDEAIATTARRVTITEAPALPEAGFFYPPTILVEKDPASAIAHEEVFGPVLTIIPFDTDEEAVAIANSVRYGLTGSVYSRDIRRALAVAGQLDSGYIWVNDTSTHLPGAPFGGVKESGIGREESLEELLDYTQLRTTSVRLD